MANRFDGRLKKLEAMQGDDVESILDGLSYEQGMVLQVHMIAQIKGSLEGGDGKPEDWELSRIPLRRDQYTAALASIPSGVPERLLAAFMERVGAAKEAA
jgi:hypothetical protein